MNKLTNYRLYDNYYYTTQLEFLTKLNIINNLSQNKLKKIRE